MVTTINPAPPAPSLDDYFQSTPIGSIDKAIGNNLFGINHRQISGAVPSNKDQHGYTFFTRPQLNMQGDNLRNHRSFYPLLTENATTLQRFVRCTLDPRLMYGYHFGAHKIAPIPCPIIDNDYAFIPVLSNNLNTISGWPDLALPTFTSKRGLFNEEYIQADGITTYYESFDLEANFKNTRGDPIVYLFNTWIHYSSLVFLGTLVPYIDMITENEIDYNTRIYRLIMDQNKDKVTKICACGAAMPISLPRGSFFDYTNDKPYNDQNKDISIRFKCVGFMDQDDILIAEFNDTVAIFNPAMRKENRDNSMIKLNKSVIHMFNNRGYPRINPSNYELEWWVTREMYDKKTRAFIESNLNSTPVVSNEEYGG